MDMAARTDTLETHWPYVDAHERDRFAGSIHDRGGDECWIWLGGIESDGGCSRFRSETLGVIAGHRWSALAHYGVLAEPVVLHRCDVRCRVRPDHLIVGTQAQHVADTVRRGRLDEPCPHRSETVARAVLQPAARRSTR